MAYAQEGGFPGCFVDAFEDRERGAANVEAAGEVVCQREHLAADAVGAAGPDLFHPADVGQRCEHSIDGTDRLSIISVSRAEVAMRSCASASISAPALTTSDGAGCLGFGARC